MNSLKSGTPSATSPSISASVVVVDVAHDHVEAVVGDGVALGLRMPGVEALAQRLPRDWTAKSTIVVVPPNAAARVPVSNVSLANVPPNGSSMWVWTSMPPGITYLPVGVDRLVGGHARPPARSAPIGRDRLAVDEHVGRLGPSAVTIVPLLISVRIGPSWTDDAVGQEGDGRRWAPRSAGRSHPSRGSG